MRSVLIVRHTWKRPRRIVLDDTGQRLLWATYVCGWWSIDVIPAQLQTRLRMLLDEIRGARC